MNKKLIVTLVVAGILSGLILVPTLQAAFTGDIDFGTSSLKVSLVEKGSVKSDSQAILTSLHGMKPGPIYNNSLQVKNTGSYDCYVRVTINKDWIKTSTGNKTSELSGSLIELNKSSGDWILDETEFDSDTVVYYYKYPLTQNSTTSNFVDSFKISFAASEFTATTTQNSNGYKTTTIKRACDGYSARIGVEIDAVQSHNGEEAILGAWGKSVSIDSNGVLSLN